MKSRILIALLALSIGLPLEAQDRVIGFLNGVHNSREDARLSLQMLAMSYREEYESHLSKEQFRQKYRTHFFYNETGCPDACMVDVFEAGFQYGVLDDVRVFWFLLDKSTWIGVMEELDAELQDYLAEMAAMVEVTVPLNSQAIIDELEVFADFGSTVALVMHSQGNFFGNFAWESLSPNAKQRISPIGVASPDSYVAGTGNYTTVDCDFIDEIPGALSFNVDSFFCPLILYKTCPVICHSFATYITGGVSSGVSKSRILRHVHEVLQDVGSATSLVANGSFSQGLAGWSRTGDFWAGTELSNYYSAPGYAAGGVDTNGYHKNGASGTLSQVVTIPTDAGTQAVLRLWINVSSDETMPGARDFFRLEIADVDTGALLGTPISLSNANASHVGEYTGYGIDLSTYIGRSLRIKFVATSDVAFPTVFRIDNVSLVVQ